MGGYLLIVPSHGERGKGALWGLFCKGTNHLITSQRPHLQIPTLWGLGFIIGTFRGHKYSVYSSYHGGKLWKVYEGCFCIISYNCM